MSYISTSVIADKTKTYPATVSIDGNLSVGDSHVINLLIELIGINKVIANQLASLTRTGPLFKDDTLST